jgi:hypothetical protein
VFLEGKTARLEEGLIVIVSDSFHIYIFCFFFFFSSSKN